MSQEKMWTVRQRFSGKLYGYEKQKWRAERVQARFKRREIMTVVREEQLEGLYEEFTEDQI